MKISKNSWHYKLGQDHGSYAFQSRCILGAHTTCSYIRGVTNALFRVTAAIIALALFAMFALSIVASMLAVPVAVMFFGVVIPAKGFLTGAATLCGIGWASTILTLVCFIIAKIVEVLGERHDAKVSLLKQAALDKKEGICTLVRFE